MTIEPALADPKASRPDSVGLPRPGSPGPALLSRWWLSVRDWLWGYDFFISYHWASGGAYAVNLAQRLRDRGYEVFLDRAEYAMGDEWAKRGRASPAQHAAPGADRHP